MRRRRRHGLSVRVCAAVVALALGHWPLAVVAEEPASASPRATMHDIFEAIATLLPLSLEEHAFEDPLRREEIRAQLRVLEQSSGVLESHAGSRDAGFRYLSRSLSRDIAELVWQYETGETEAARVQVAGVTQNCVACHSRLPTGREFPMAAKLTERIEITSLPRPERARLQVAVRRFDDALDTWEAHFRDPAVRPEQLDIGGDLVDYLAVAIRVEGDLPRARRALSGLAARDDVPPYLARHLTAWRASLEELAPIVRAAPDLARARGLVEQGNALSVFPGGRERLVHDLVASSLLHRLVAKGDDGPEVAEAYYLLGVIEARSIDSYWVPQTEFHLEAAIRADPTGPVAPRAYAALEEYVLIGYGGLSEADVPPEVREHLAELRALLRTPAAKP